MIRSTPARGARLLATAALIALVFLVVVNRLTEGRIAEAQQQMMLDNLGAVLPDGPFDNNPLDSARLQIVPALAGTSEVALYTVYRNQQPLAAAMEIMAPDGYSGSIRMLLGVHATGEIIAVRVIAHRETPGLGDRIEYRKSPWITQFNGQSLALSTPANWQLSAAGGEYDALTGATITSRAIIQAVHRALKWFQDNRKEIFPT